MNAFPFAHCAIGIVIPDKCPLFVRINESHPAKGQISYGQ